VRILEAKQALDDCIVAQEFSHAARFKDSITELENERGLLLQANSSQPADQEVRTEKARTLKRARARAHMLPSVCTVYNHRV